MSYEYTKEVDELLKTNADLRAEGHETREQLKALEERFNALNDQRIGLTLDLEAARAAKGDPLIEIAVRGRLRAVSNDSGQITVFSIGKDGKRQFKVDASSGKAVEATADDIAAELRSLLKETAVKAEEKAKTTKGDAASANPWLKTAGSPYGNITEQMRVLKRDPALAAKLQAEADAVQAEAVAQAQNRASIPELHRRVQAGDRNAVRQLKAVLDAKIAERSLHSTEPNTKN